MGQKESKHDIVQECPTGAEVGDNVDLDISRVPNSLSSIGAEVANANTCTDVSSDESTPQFEAMQSQESIKGIEEMKTSQHDVSQIASPKEIAELDKTNYAIALGEDESSLIVSIDGNGGGNEGREIATRDEVNELDQTIRPIKIDELPQSFQLEQQHMMMNFGRGKKISPTRS